MTTKVYVLDINPEPWAMGTAFALRGRKGAGISPNRKLVAFKEAAREAIQSAYTTFKFTGPVSVRLYFSRALETMNYGAKTSHANQSDATNMQKAFEDAMQDILYENDRQVVDIHSTIVHQSPDAKPMIVVEITDEVNTLMMHHEDRMHYLIERYSAPKQEVQTDPNVW